MKPPGTSWLESDRACIAATFLFCVLVIYVPILIAGFPYGSDQRQHLRFSLAVQTSLVEGTLTPNWTNDNGGYGEVGIRFYPPLVYVTTAAFYAISGNWYDAFSLNLAFWMCVGSLGMFFFCREWVGPKEALLGALLFAIVPYHLTQIFQYFLYAEFAAFSLLPYCFLFLTRICRGERLLDVLWLSTVCSMLILSHIPLSLIAALSMLPYVFFVTEWTSYRLVFSRLLLACASIVLLTGFRVATLLFETSWLAHDSSVFTRDHYSFSTWLFPNVWYPRRMLVMEQVSWLFDITIVLTVLLAIPSIAYAGKHLRSTDRSAVKVILGLAMSATFSFFMLSQLSYAIWDSLPILQKVQFPWRWLSPLSFFAVAGFAICMPKLIASSQRLTRPIAYFGVSLILAIVLYDVTQSIVTAGGQTREEFSKMVQEVHDDTDADYWWPIWARKGAFDQSERVSMDHRSYSIQTWDREFREFSVDAGLAGDVRIATFFYPYWTATVNGSTAMTRPDVNGVILVSLPSEAAVVKLHFVEPPIYHWIKLGSLFAWGLMFVILLGIGIRGTKRSDSLRPEKNSPVG